MNSIQLAACIAFATISFVAAAPNPADQAQANATPKPQQPAPKKPPAKKPKAVKPQPSRKDLALKEARACDRDKNGRLDGLEVMTLNNVFKSNPDSFLYLFDEDGNHSLDTTEIAAINELIKPKKK